MNPYAITRALIRSAWVVLVSCAHPRAHDDTSVSDSAPPTCAGTKTCSADLHDVLCDGNFLETCPSGTGCGTNGECVSACLAAAENGSTIGCDYYSVAPDVIQLGRNACFAAFIANTWNEPVSISVERNGQMYATDRIAYVPQGQGQSLTYAPVEGGVLAANQIAIVFLAGFGCPVGINVATTEEVTVYGTGYGHAFRITSSAPIVAWDMYPYAGGALADTSATLLLPTSSWAADYIGVSAYHGIYEQVMAVVGAENDTSVTIVPTVAVVGGAAVSPAPAGAPMTYALDRGEVLQFTQSNALSGSTIHSDKPIGLWGGATCLAIDVDDLACDSAHQQIPPVVTLGHRYAAVRYRDRFAGQDESVPWRIFGAVDGTVLTYSRPIPGAPDTLSRGEVAQFWTSGPFVVTSQDVDHPFYVSAHMTGCSRVSGARPPMPAIWDCRGDPEFVNVVALDQYLASYTFFTDPTFPETNIVLARERKNDVFADVTLDCVGIVTGWQPVDPADDFEFARVDLVTGDFESVGSCNNGLHHASSVQPFGLVVWGWGSLATEPAMRTTTNSYAYPAGASVRPINSVVIFQQY